MHRLRVQFIGPVRRPGPERALEIDPVGIATVGDLLLRLGYAEHEHQSLTVIVDGARAALEQSIEGAKSVEILIALGGG
jgi:hypothetical protein